MCSQRILLVFISRSTALEHPHVSKISLQFPLHKAIGLNNAYPNVEVSTIARLP